MKAAVSKRDRWLALGLLGLVVVLAYLLLVHAWWSVPMLQVGARIEAARERELRVRMQVRQAPDVAKQLAAAQAQQAQRPGFLAEATPELATAGLVKRLETVVLEASPGNRSCAIVNRSPFSQQADGRFTPVVVQVRLRCGMPELAAVLHALESGAPRLFVDNLSVLAQNYAFSAGTAASNESGGLEVSFDLYGYLKPRPAAAAPGTGGADAN